MATRTWDNDSGDGKWSTDANWSGDTKPTTGDDVVFDSTSAANCSIDEAVAALSSFTIALLYTGTITVNVNQTNSMGTFSLTGGTFKSNGYNWICGNVTISGTSGKLELGSSSVTWISFTRTAGNAYTFVMGSSTITMSGDWTDNTTSGTYWAGSSTVVFSVNCNVKSYRSLSPGGGDFYNITINTGVTVTMTSSISFGVSGVLTLSGTATLTATGTYDKQLLNCRCTITNPIVVSGSHTISNIGYYFLYEANATAINLISFNGSFKYVHLTTYNKHVLFTMTGDITTAPNGYVSPYSAYVGGTSMSCGLYTANYNISTTDIIIGYASSPTHIRYIICGSSTITTTNVTIHGNSDYLVFNTSSWTVSGNWTCASTSSSWSAGTATINFNGASAQTLGLNNGNSSNIKYYNITISNSSAVNITMGAYTATILGAMNCTTTTATIKWDTNNGNLALTGDLTLANGCGWVAGNGNMTFNGNPQTITDNNTTKKNLGNVVIATDANVTYNYILTISGTIINNGTWNIIGDGTISSTWSNLTINASGVLNTASGQIYVRFDGETFGTAIIFRFDGEVFT